MAATNETSTLLPNALGSAAAGILSRICTHPLDTSKARLQASPALLGTDCAATTPIRYTGPLDVLVHTARTEGVRGLYRGFGAVIVGGTPGTILYLCSYEIVKSQLSSTFDGESNFVVHFCSGIVAETIACTIYVPVDVIKERMQVQHSVMSPSKEFGNYSNSWDALKKILKTEGLAGIYRGYGATLASFGPFSALYFVFYERFKESTKQHLQTNTSHPIDVEIPFQWTVVCAACAGALASWLTSPLDMAKLRLQVQRGKLHGREISEGKFKVYGGMVDCLQQTFREGGAKALFRGAGARVLHFAPATTVTMTTYEFCRSFFRQAFAWRPIGGRLTKVTTPDGQIPRSPSSPPIIDGRNRKGLLQETDVFHTAYTRSLPVL